MAKSYKHLDIQDRAVLETQLSFGMRAAAVSFHHHPGDEAQRLEAATDSWRRQADHRWRVSSGAGQPPGAASGRRGAHSTTAGCRQPVVEHRGRPSRSRLESGADPEHTGSYAGSGPALVRDHLHLALRHAARAAAFQPADPDAPPPSRQKATGAQGRARQAVDPRHDLDRSEAHRARYLPSGAMMAEPPRSIRVCGSSPETGERAAGSVDASRICPAASTKQRPSKA